MCDALMWSFDAITSVNWFEVVKSFASLAVAATAFFALRNWQRQDKAKREAEFLDALIEGVHAYIVELPLPVTLVDMAKIGMASHVATWEQGEEADKVLRGAIAYIQANGKQDAKRLLESLEALRPSLIKLRSLAAKGQVFKFNGYAKCHDAVSTLAQQFDRMQAFASIVGSPTLNWDNPEVERRLKNIMDIEPDDIRRHIQESNVAALEFASETYARIYG